MQDQQGAAVQQKVHRLGSSRHIAAQQGDQPLPVAQQRQLGASCCTASPAQQHQLPEGDTCCQPGPSQQANTSKASGDDCPAAAAGAADAGLGCG